MPRWDEIWPWVWPSLCLLGWVVLTGLAGRRLRAWAHRQAADEGKTALDESVLVRLVALVRVAAFLGGVLAWAYLAPFSETVDTFLADHVKPWVLPTMGLIAFIVLGIFLIRRGLKMLAHRAQHTNTELDDVIIGAIRRPLLFVLVVVAVRLWVDYVPVAAAVRNVSVILTKVSIIVLILMTVDGFSQAWIVRRGLASRVLETAGPALRTGLRVVIFITGVLMILDAFEIDVTAIVASIGISSLAVALALQHTLEDFLAGLLIAADQSVRLGDFVEVDADTKGYVLNIGWRTTRIKTRDDMHIVVPNSKLGQATLVNRNLPEVDVCFTVPVGVSYASDLRHVVHETLEVARSLQRDHAAAIASYDPRVVFSAFGESSVDFAVWLRARSWEDHFGLKSAFIRALHDHYRKTGIVIPFPMRTLDVPAGTVIHMAGVSAEGVASPAPPASPSTPETSE